MPSTSRLRWTATGRNSDARPRRKAGEFSRTPRSRPRRRVRRRTRWPRGSRAMRRAATSGCARRSGRSKSAGAGSSTTSASWLLSSRTSSRSGAVRAGLRAARGARGRPAPLTDVADELRSLLRGLPTGVAVLTVDADGDQLGLTVTSVVSLSLEPPLVGVVGEPAGGDARAAAPGERVRAQPARRRPGGRRAALRPRRPASRRTGTASTGARARPARRSWPARSAGSRRASSTSTPSAATRSSSAASSPWSRAARARLSSAWARGTRPCDRGGRLRPRRHHRRLRARLGRRPPGARGGARRPLARPGLAGHDGHELAGVVALHARRDRAGGVARGDQRGGGASAWRPSTGPGSPSSRERSRRWSGSPPAGRWDWLRPPTAS